jgi:hypothetical protein
MSQPVVTPHDVFPGPTPALDILGGVERRQFLKQPVRRQPFPRLPSTRFTGTLPGLLGPLLVEQRHLLVSVSVLTLFTVSLTTR